MDRKDNGGINFLNISSAWAIFPQNIILLRFQNLVPPNQKFIQIAWSYNQLQKYLRHFTPVHVAYFGWTDLPIILCLWSPPTPVKVASNIEACSRLEGTTLNGRKEASEYFISQTWNHQQFNPRTYTQIHTPTKVQKGGGLIQPLPAVFDMLQYFEMILPLVESLTDLLNKMRYILWVVALMEACDITNNGCHLDRYLGFYQEVEIRLKPWEIVMFCVLHGK